MTNDGIDMPGGGSRGTPLPPVKADELRAVGSDLAASAADVHQTLMDHLQSASDEVDQHAADVAMTIQSHMGQTDADLIPHESATKAVLANVLDKATDEVLHSEAELEQNGVHIPILADQIRSDLNDETGEAMVSRLMGQPPTEVLPVPSTGITDGDTTTICDPFGSGPCSPLPPPVPGAGPGAPVVPVPPRLPVDPFPPLAPPPPPPPPDESAPEEPPSDCECECPVSPPPPPPPTTPRECDCPAPIIEVTCPAPIIQMPPGNAQPPPTSPPPPAPPEEPVPVPVPPIELPSPPPPPPPADSPLLPPGPEPLAPQPLFADRNVCSILDLNFGLYQNLYRMPAPGESGNSSSVSDILRTGLGLVQSIGDSVFGTGARSQDRAQTMTQAYTITGDWLGGYSQALTVFDLLDKRFLPYPETAFSLAFVLGAAHKAEGSSGMPLDYLTTGIQYLYKAANPQYIADQPELDKLYIAGDLTYEQWYCYTKMHGNIPELRTDILKNMRPVPTLDQIPVLENRGGSSAELANIWWNQNGARDEASRIPYREMAKFVPGPGDLVRFMVRDSFDETVVKDGQLDKDFAAKFYGAGGIAAPGPAATWAKANGMTDEQFKFFWYSHWQYPSNTALYEMLHRLRPDRPEVTDWDSQFGPQAAKPNPVDTPPRPLVLTLSDIKRIVEINDMAPAMVDPLLAVSYHPINRTDGIQAYLSGAFTEKQLYHCFRDNGYDDATANTMVQIQVTASARRNNNMTGLWSIKDTIKAYKEGLIDGARADTFLQPLMPNNAERARALQLADLQVVAENNRAWIGQIRREYIFGATDDATCIAKLKDFGVTDRRAKDLNDTWRAARVGKFREPTAKMVLGWLTLAIISVQDCAARLFQLGFVKPDVDRMVTQAIINWGERTEGRIDKTQKKLDAVRKQAKDVVREADSVLKQREAGLSREIAALQATLDRVQAEMRDRVLPGS